MRVRSDLVDALAGEQRPGGDRMPERVHRGDRACWCWDGLPACVDLVKCGEGWLAAGLGRPLLRGSERPADVALPERATGAGGEHERIRTWITCGPLVTGENVRQLSWDRHRASRAVCLRGRRWPWRSTWKPNVTSASSRSSSLRASQVRPQSSEILAPVRAASVNSVRYGLRDALRVCSICSGVKIGSRLDHERSHKYSERKQEEIVADQLSPCRPQRWRQSGR